MSDGWSRGYGESNRGGGSQRRGNQHRGRRGRGARPDWDQMGAGGGRQTGGRGGRPDWDQMGAGGGRQTDDGRGRPPPHLKGRDLGMWYAKRGRGRGHPEGLKGRDIGMHYANKYRARDKLEERLATHEVNMDEGKERHLTNLLANIKTAELCPPQPSRSYQDPDAPTTSTGSATSTSNIFQDEVSSSFRRQICDTPEKNSRSDFSVLEYSQNWSDEGTTPHYIPLDRNPLGFDNNHKRFNDEDEKDPGNSETVVDDWSERLSNDSASAKVASVSREVRRESSASTKNVLSINTDQLQPVKLETTESYTGVKTEPDDSEWVWNSDNNSRDDDRHSTPALIKTETGVPGSNTPRNQNSMDTESGTTWNSSVNQGNNGADIAASASGISGGSIANYTPDDAFSDDDDEEMIKMTQEAERRDQQQDFIPLSDQDNEDDDEDFTMVPQFRHDVDENEDDMSFLCEFTAHRESNRSREKLNRAESASCVRGITRDPVLDEHLVNELRDKQNNQKFNQMMQFRQKLPSYGMREEIISMVASNQVVVLSGETGCGKTTQVPQFILDDYIEKGAGSTCSIVCTQPRRISAISVAERVAEERAERCGDASVGFQIRLENKLPRKAGSILYCTTGIMLKWLVSDEHLKRVTHIILDEIHERDILSDFLMIILKDLLPRRRDLKLILMSATLNANMFSQYFGGIPMLNIPGFTFPVTEVYLENIIEMTGFRCNAQSSDRRKNQYSRNKKDKKNEMNDKEYQIYLRNLVGTCHPYVIKELENYNFSEINVSLCEQLIAHICRTKQDGAILVFLPGWTDIQKVNTALTENMMFRSSRYVIIPLHSLLPTVNQRQVFERPPPGVRKIVLATNIAETSITIDDVVFVIDCGKIKMTTLDVKSNLSTLKAEWVSHANAKQRRGRAGRVQAGECYRLYTKFQESKFNDYLLPEMLRTRLEDLCLQIKILRLGGIEPFIKKAMEPPSMDSLKLSIGMLSSINALDENEDLTPLGYHLAKMPVDCQMGKMLLFGAMFCCIDPILTVAACLSYKDPFVLPMGKMQDADRVRLQLSEDSQSDHIVLVNAYKGWERAKSRGTDRQYCWDHFMAPSILKLLSGMRKQLMDLLRDMKFVDNNNPQCYKANKNSNNLKLVKAVIAAGLYPNVGKVKFMEKKGGRPNLLYLKPPPVGQMVYDERKRIYVPEKALKFEFFMKSVNIQTRLFESKWIVFYQKLKTMKNYILDSTVVPPLPLLFFGGNISTRVENGENLMVVDDWIIFKASPKIASIVKDLCSELDKLLDYKITHPGVTNWDNKTKEGALMHAILELLTSENVTSAQGRRDGYIRPKFY